jgi:hypothetical protein
MVKRIILLGDSFTFGHGCSDKVYYYDPVTKQHVGEKMSPKFEATVSEYCWGSLLQKRFPHIEVMNIAKPGHCFLGMFRDLINLQQYVELTPDDLVLLNGSFVDRTEIAHPTELDRVISWSIGNDPELNTGPQFNEPVFIDAKRVYTKYLYNTKIGYNQFLASVMGMYGICKLYDSQFAFSVPKNVMLTQTLTKDLRTLKFPHMYEYDFSGNNDSAFNDTCYLPDRHCNNLGHEIYLEKVVLPFLLSKGFL